MDSNVKLLKDDSYSKKVDPVQCQSMVSSPLHVAKAKCPDIAHAVGIVSRFSATPTQAHLIKRIFQYLNCTIDLKLNYRPTGRKLLGYSDADWENDLENRYSTTGNNVRGGYYLVKPEASNSCTAYS